MPRHTVSQPEGEDSMQRTHSMVAGLIAVVVLGGSLGLLSCGGGGDSTWSGGQWSATSPYGTTAYHTTGYGTTAYSMTATGTTAYYGGTYATYLRLPP